MSSLGGAGASRHAIQQGLLDRASSLTGSEYGKRPRTQKAAVRRLFTLWAEGAREAAVLEEQPREAAHAAQLAQLADLELSSSRVLAELEEARTAAAASHARAVAYEVHVPERAILGGLGAQLVLMQEQAKARDREVRISELHAVALRRLQHFGVLRAWGTWRELYEHRAHHREHIIEVLSTMRNPGLARSLGRWRNVWRLQAELARKVEHTEALRKQAELGQRFVEVERERLEALESVASVRSHLVEAQQTVHASSASFRLL